MSNGQDVVDNWEEIDEKDINDSLQKLHLQAKDFGNSKAPNEICDTDEPSEGNKRTAASTGSALIAEAKPPVVELLHGTSCSTNDVACVTESMIDKAANSQLDVMANAFEPVMMILHKNATDCDAGNYTPALNQKVKILRRPTQHQEMRNPNGVRPKAPIKTLQQREQEYAEARLRILGVAKNPKDDKSTTNSSVTTTVSTVTAQSGVPATARSNITTTTTISAPTTSTSFVRMPISKQMPNLQQTLVGNNGAIQNYAAMPTLQQNIAINAGGAQNHYYNNIYYQQGTSTPQLTSPPPPPQHMNYYFQQHPQMHPQAINAVYNTRIAPLQQQQPQKLNHHHHHHLTHISNQHAPPQTWSPVVGGSVSSAALRQPPQLLQQHQLQQQHLQQQAQNLHNYNDNVLRLPRGPCPNGALGFQIRR